MAQEVRVINFMRFRKVASVISLALVLVSIGSLVFQGIKYGLDFTGGTQIEVTYEETADLDAVRAVLAEEGFQNYEVSYFGSEQDVLIRIQDTGGADVDPQVAAQTGDRVVALLQETSDARIELQRSEYVGSVVGDELKEQGALGVLVSLGMMMIYISLRFQYKFAMSTVAALTEDVLITLGVFSLFQIDFDLTVLAAVLAVVGYGLNDTIVLCDRIRENFRIMRKTDAEDIINLSISQTIGRTAITSFTTLLVVFALFFLGGDTVHGFALALIVGVVFSTWSTTFVATNALLSLKISKEDLMPPVKEQEELDALP